MLRSLIFRSENNKVQNKHRILVFHKVH